MIKYQYEHVFVQHLAEPARSGAIPMDVVSSLNAWGADGWQIVHMEGVWDWQTDRKGLCAPETLRGYYVTFKREIEGNAEHSAAVAEAEATVSLEFSC
jgi:hypothetical protein